MDRIQKQELHEMFQKAIQGEVNALNGLYEKYYRLVYSIAFSILKNKEDSEDVAQNVFAKIFQINTDKLPTANEASWLYSLTKNETLNYLRTKKENVNLDEIYYLTEEDKELNKIIAHDEWEYEIVPVHLIYNEDKKRLEAVGCIPGRIDIEHEDNIAQLRDITAIALSYVQIELEKEQDRLAEYFVHKTDNEIKTYVDAQVIL